VQIQYNIVADKTIYHWCPKRMLSVLLFFILLLWNVFILISKQKVVFIREKKEYLRKEIIFFQIKCVGLLVMAKKQW